MQPPFPLSERIWKFFVEDSTPLGRLDAILFVMFKAFFPRHQSPHCSAFICEFIAHFLATVLSTQKVNITLFLSLQFALVHLICDLSREKGTYEFHRETLNLFHGHKA